MVEITRHDVELAGCTPQPLMAYLKALGILRLISEQKDADARGWWKNDVFWLRSSLDRDALVTFFLEEYQPTPIVAPWAGGSGFFKKDKQEAVKALGKSNSPRVSSYGRVINDVQGIIKEENIHDKPREDHKSRLIRRYRNELPDEVVAWIDAAMVLHEDKQNFAPLLGTGGNDGRLDFTRNFMQRIVLLGLHELGLHEAGPAHNDSHSWIKNALFGTPAALALASAGQFVPERVGGPNATQGMEGAARDNPWDFLLMLEGTLFFAGAATRRLGAVESSRTTFPFTVRLVGAGFDSSAVKDGAGSRGELWLPLWTRPASASELRQLFAEGRAEVSGHPAQDGTDFARSVAGLGVDRGITEFSRFGFLKRSGKAFLATPLGRFEVIGRSGVDLLREVDDWLDRLRRACSGKKTPPRFLSALHRIDSAIFDFCKYGGEQLFQGILVALGAAESMVASSKRFRAEQKLRPLAGLSLDWVSAADDDSNEFAIALALASIHDPEKKIGPLRSNLEPVDWNKRCRAWAEKDRAVIWNAADLPVNLVSVLEHRVMDGARVGCERLPLASHCMVPLGMIAKFLAGELDDERIDELIWGLTLINICGYYRAGGNAHDAPVPRAYALLKLLFLPRPLVLERAANGTLRARMQRSNESGGLVIRPEASILQLLRAGRLGEACVIGMRRLRASGLAPMPRPVRGRRVRDHDWDELNYQGSAGIDPLRLAAALLIPIGDDAVSRLVRLVIADDSFLDHPVEAASLAALEGETPS
jgi:CRISPR-associated protein Csx17